MTRLPFRLATCLLALLVAAPAQGSEQAWYAWLAFGPEGKVRFLLRLEGDALTLERRDGDRPVGKPLRFASLQDCQGVTAEDPDGKTSYLLKGVEDLKLVKRLGKALAIDVEVKGPARYAQGARVQLASRLAAAPTVRFHAPLRVGVAEDMKPTLFNTLVWRPPAGLALVKGDKPTELFVTVRNKAAEAGSYTVVTTTDPSGKTCLFPDKVRPAVDVEFPPREPGGKPVRKRYALDRFC